MSPEGLADLKKIRDRIPRLKADADNQALVRIDVDFHRTIYRETQNQYLAATLDRMLSHYLRFWLSSPNQIRADKFFSETKEMIRALEEKDEIRLRAATLAHIKASLDEIMGVSPL
jgi:DNA-binding GntR family transcriptional regulator